MHLRVRSDWFAASLLAAVGLGPLACGGNAATKGSAGGNSATGGSVAAGGSGGGGRSDGDPSSGARTGAAGSANGGVAANPDGSPVNQFPCKSPTPLTSGNSGYERCENGVIIRRAIVNCENPLPRKARIADYNAAVDRCQYDSDCTERALGYCTRDVNGQGVPPRASCRYGCTADADCEANSICVCGDPVGHCSPASCSSDAACVPGFHCASYDSSGGCQRETFACQTPADRCATNSDGPGAHCRIATGSVTRTCEGAQCAIGRPFLVDEVARVAAPCSRQDWQAASLSPQLSHLDSRTRAALAAQWTRAAQLEHASIAAFARFLLELLAFGAPADLVRDTASAIEDERRHATQCFALASAYAGRAIGPAGLDVDGAVNSPDLQRSVLCAIREGCVGETVAALEAAELGASVRDPALRRTLSAIAADEKRHAELAWRFVIWACERQPAIRHVVSLELAAIENELTTESPPTTSAADRDLAADGVLSSALERCVRRAALTDAVLPGLRSLLSRAAA